MVTKEQIERRGREQCTATTGHPHSRCELAEGHPGPHSLENGAYQWPIEKLPRGYITKLEEIARTDLEVLRKKDAEYGGSWKKRGGVGAYMMAARKIDRMEVQVAVHHYDIFKAAAEDKRDEGIIDDIRDLRRYLLLIEAEILSQASEHNDK